MCASSVFIVVNEFRIESDGYIFISFEIYVQLRGVQVGECESRKKVSRACNNAISLSFSAWKFMCSMAVNLFSFYKVTEHGSISNFILQKNGSFVCDNAVAFIVPKSNYIYAERQMENETGTLRGNSISRIYWFGVFAEN